MDHYRTLGISPQANQDQIRSAFRKVARKHHPDVSSSEESIEKFHLAKEAYEVLIDPERRQAYDATREHERKIKEDKSKAASEHATQAQEHRSAAGELLRMSMLLNTHRFKDAEAVARNILRSDPKSAHAYAALGESARARGDMEATARYFAYAAQYAPDNKLFIERSMAAQEALAKREGRSADRLDRSAPFALGAGVFTVVVSAIYVVLAAESAALPWLKPVSAWPASLFFMLLIAGLSAGVSLSLGGALDTYDIHRGSVMARVPPATALCAVAVLSFWLALAFYILVGATQNAFNASMSRLLAAVTLAVIVFSLAAYNLGSLAGSQTFLWGGNLVYPAAAVGWFVADSLKS